MKSIYLILSGVGFVLPNIFVAMESARSGNILFYLDPVATFEGMFANYISSAFMVDLLFAVMIFMIWSYREAKQHKIKHLGVVWVLTFMLGIAGTFPLFLYLRSKQLESGS